jgi:hypothetical protein
MYFGQAQSQGTSGVTSGAQTFLGAKTFESIKFSAAGSYSEAIVLGSKRMICVGDPCITSGLGQNTILAEGDHVRFKMTAYFSGYGGGDVVGADGTFISYVGSGSNAFRCNSTGCRYDIGGGSGDYLVSNTTMISTPAPFQPGSFATGSLPTCVTGTPTTAQAGPGAIARDSTLGKLVVCEGGSWAVIGGQAP